MFWVMLEECFVFFAGFKQDSPGFLGTLVAVPDSHHIASLHVELLVGERSPVILSPPSLPSKLLT
jgi:hypothetical protein